MVLWHKARGEVRIDDALQRWADDVVNEGVQSSTPENTKTDAMKHAVRCGETVNIEPDYCQSLLRLELLDDSDQQPCGTAPVKDIILCEVL